MFLIFFGIIILAIGLVSFLISAFQNSIWWGLSCLLFSPVSVIFLILHWQDAKKSFFLQLIGIALIFAGSHFLGPPADLSDFAL